ncbi:hypothetical protein BDR26DRAFT_952113 [Obelidium mucronatum]|nr:hypothetical protein BDR26DRAFT_952113 [Obelidium mucronatum]
MTTRLPPLPTINEPTTAATSSQKAHNTLRHAGSMPVFSINHHHHHQLQQRKNNNHIMSSQLSKKHNSDPNLTETTSARETFYSSSSSIDDKNNTSTIIQPIRKPEWLKTIPKLQNPKGNLPKGASILFRTEFSDLDLELQNAQQVLKTWGQVQAKALEALVCANKDLKSYKQPVVVAAAAVTPPSEQTGTTTTTPKTDRLTSAKNASASKRQSPPKSASKTGTAAATTNNLKAATTSKTGKSATSLIKKGPSIHLPVGKDPRTGITIGEENVTSLLASSSTMEQQQNATPTATIKKEKPKPENWPDCLWDKNFTLTPMYISETLYRLAPDDETLTHLRDSPLNKTEWVTKIIHERALMLERLAHLESRFGVAEKDMKWIAGHRDYGASKSMMVSTIFSDYAQDNALRVPGLGCPESDVPVSELELLHLGAPTSGIFNQVRNVMISRTDNGLQHLWLMKRNISDNFEVPGILEVESADHNDINNNNNNNNKLRALEPPKQVSKKPKNSMKPFQQDETRILTKMRQRVNFLRNPRFPYTHPPVDCIGILREDVMPINAVSAAKPHLTNSTSTSTTTGIIALPSPSITFTNYQPHQTYTQHVTLKNQSTHSVRFRMSIPPPYHEYSPFFKVTMVGTPTQGGGGGGGGLVAPGMGCVYRVEFTPDTLADYKQVLVVSTEVSGGGGTGGVSGGGQEEPFVVVLTGERAAPELTMPDVLHCGPCRDGFVAVRTWKFKNVGGPGRFMILGRDGEGGGGGDGGGGGGGGERDVARMFEGIGHYVTEEEYRKAIGDKANELPHSHTLTQDAFEIYPSYFSLLTGESKEITVKFRAAPIMDDNNESAPTSAKTTATRKQAPKKDTFKIETILQIACDNCQVLTLPLRANIQKPTVAITACDPPHMRVLEQESWDIEGVRFGFGSQNLAATTTLSLTVKNMGRLRLPFRWVPVENPGNTVGRKKNYSVSFGADGGGGGGIGGGENGDSLITLSDSFTFSPSEGVFPPNGEITFQVSFTPTRVKKYDVIGRLCLLEEGERVYVDKETGAACVFTNKNDGSIQAVEPECVLEIFCTGIGLEYTVQVKPELILCPSDIYVGYSKETHIRIVNSSISAVSYEWSVEGIDTSVMQLAISVPDVDCVAPGRDLEFLVSMVGVFPGIVRGTLVCKTANGIGPLIRVPIHAKISLKPGDLEFGATMIDFGLIALGSLSECVVPLANNSKLPLHYKLVAHPSSSSMAAHEPIQGTENTGTGTAAPWEVNISAPEGILSPGEQINLALVYTPKVCQNFSGILACEILSPSGGDSLQQKSVLVTAIKMHALVQTPCAKIQHPSTSLLCFVNVPFVWTLTITNETLLPTRLEWKHPHKNSNNSNVMMRFHPAHIEPLGPAESMDVQVELTFTEIGDRQVVEFECHVDGMVEENGGVLKAWVEADVVGLSVDLKFPSIRPTTATIVSPAAKTTRTITQEGNTGEMCVLEKKSSLDFGNDCPIFETRTLEFIIQNKSAIASPFRLWVESFTALGVDKPGFDEDVVADSTACKGSGAGKLILQPTEKPKIGFSSTTGKQWLDNMTAVRKTIQKMNLVLKEGRGAAFHPTPSHGIIAPFGHVKVKVTSYNNLVGLYKDNLVCEVGSWLRQVVPMSLGVDGVPVKFSGAQLMASKNISKVDRINFGTQIAQHGRRVPLPAFGMDYYTHARKSVFLRLGNPSVYGRNPRNAGSTLDEVDEDAPIANVTKKEIQVENQSPRTICLRWNVFVKRQSLSSIVAQQKAGALPTTAEIDALLLDELINNNPMTSPVVMQPAPMFIPAFQTVSARISFCAKETGYYKALLVADVGYVQPDGSISYSPNGYSMEGEEDFLDNNGTSFEGSLMAPLQKLQEKENARFPQDLSLPRIRKVRLLVQAKVIEPILVVDDPSISAGAAKIDDESKNKSSAIWFKRVKDDEIAEIERLHKKRQEEVKEQKLKQEREEAERKRQILLAQHKNTQSVFIYSDELNPSIVNSNVFTDEKLGLELSDTTSSVSKLMYMYDDEAPTTYITLRNYTDTLSSFCLSVSSKDIFKVAKVEKPQTPSARIPKASPKQETTFEHRTLSLVGTPRIKPSTDQASYRTSRVSATAARLPFTAPTAKNTTSKSTTSLSKVSMVTSKPESSKKGKTPVLLGEEEDELCDDMIYELNPMETIRIAVECINTDILKTTTIEDNCSTNPSYLHSRATSPSMVEGGLNNSQLGVDSRPGTTNKKSMVFAVGGAEAEDHSRDYVKGHLKVLFTNGSIQSIPILCED